MFSVFIKYIELKSKSWLETYTHTLVMGWFLILHCVLIPVALFVQMLGLILLYQKKILSRNINQMYILIVLCHTGNAFVVFSILYMLQLFSTWVTTILEKCLSVLYYSLMILLTSDRFLVFYLNMKYPICCTPKKLLKIIFLVVAVSLILVLILALAIQFEVINILKLSTVTQYVYISVDTFYITIVVFTYTYIFVKFKRQKKLRRNMSFSGKKNQDHFNLKVSTLVIATFILFNVCPNFLAIFIRTSSGDGLSMEPEIPHVMYILGWIADPLIYVCTQRTRPYPKSIKKALEKHVKFPKLDNKDTWMTCVIIQYGFYWLHRIYFVFFLVSLLLA